MNNAKVWDVELYMFVHVFMYVRTYVALVAAALTAVVSRCPHCFPCSYCVYNASSIGFSAGLHH